MTDRILSDSLPAGRWRAAMGMALILAVKLAMLWIALHPVQAP